MRPNRGFAAKGRSSDAGPAHCAERKKKDIEKQKEVAKGTTFILLRKKTMQEDK
jgi:hypothetical protein